MNSYFNVVFTTEQQWVQPYRVKRRSSSINNLTMPVNANIIEL